MPHADIDGDQHDDDDDDDYADIDDDDDDDDDDDVNYDDTTHRSRTVLNLPM